jgi:translocation and assembly module TamB
MRWKRLRRIALWTTTILLVLATGLLVGLRFYLSSRAALPVVARGLQSVLGGPVQVGGAHIALVGDSTLHNVRAFEESRSGQPPWLLLEDVEADLSAWGAIRGEMPSQIDISGGRIELHFDRDGKLVTHLPAGKGGPMPRLHLDRGQLTLVQQGRPPFVLKGITADVVSRDQAIQLVGSVNDPTWGEWNLAADFVTGEKVEVHAVTPQCHVTIPMLTALPFVPPNVWKHVRIEGKTPARVDIAVAFGPEKPRVHYRVELSPREAHLEVPSIALVTEKTQGDVVIEDGKVQLRNVTGQYAEGSISTDGDLDFNPQPDVLHFSNLHIKGIMLHDLPREWKIPAGVDGRLSGDADLTVFIDKGKVRTRGNGEGKLENARWSMVHLKKPIKFYLVSDGTGFHFRHQLQRPNTGETESSAKASPLEEVVSGLQDDLQHLSTLPVRLTGQLMDGVGWMVREPPGKVRRGLHYVMTPPPPGKEEPTYLEVDLSLDDIKLEELITRLNLKLPYSIVGLASVQAHAAIPINRPHDLKLYRFEGKATAPTLRIADVALTNLRGSADYKGGILKLEKVQGEVPGPQQAGKARTVGKLEGNARLTIVPRGDMSLHMSVERLPVDLLTVFVPGVKPNISGALTGTIDARVPLERLGEPAAWQGTAALHAPEVDVYGVSLANPDAVLEVARGVARLTHITATFGGADLKGSGRMELAGKMAYDGEVHVARINRALLDQLSRQSPVPMQIRGEVEASAQAKGTLHPFVLSTEGSMNSGAVAISGVQLESLRLKWRGDERQIKVPTLDARLYGGRVTGSAVVPVSENQAGSAELRLDDIQLKNIAQKMGGLPVRLEGVLAGTARATITGATADKPRELSTKIELDSPELRVQGIPVTHLRGDFDYRAGEAEYRLEGNSLGGRISLQGKTPFPLPAAPQGHSEPAEPADPPPRQDTPRSQGRLELRGIQLGRLWPYLRLQEALGPLSGSLSMVLPFELGPGARASRTGRFEITGLRWEAEELADLITGEVRLTRDTIRARNISAGLGEGSLRGSFSYPWRKGGIGSFSITLEQLDVRRLFVFYPALRSNIQGVIDGHLRGRLNQEWQGGGTLVLAHARIFGLDVAQWRVPLTFTFAPTEGSGEVSFSDSVADIARGRAQAQGRLSWGAGLDLRALLRFYEVDIGALLHNFGSIGSYAAGKITGRADFSGDQMHSVNDLRARVQAHLRDTQALSLPVLRVLTPYLRPGISSATFQSGGLQGRLANGVFNVESLTLASEVIELVLVGTVTLTSRLDLDVSTRTGLLLQNPTNLRTLGLQVRNVTTLPLAVLTQAATLLANRVVHLHLTGTLSSPVIQVLPARLLPEEAIRFFLLRAADAPLP